MNPLRKLAEKLNKAADRVITPIVEQEAPRPAPAPKPEGGQ